MNRTVFLAAVLTAAALTGIFSTHPIAAYAGGDYEGGDGSETKTEQKLKQKKVESGESTNFNLMKIRSTVLQVFLHVIQWL